jgi:hypothetical protein
MQDLKHLSNKMARDELASLIQTEFKRLVQRNGESLLARIFLEQVPVLIRNFAL